MGIRSVSRSEFDAYDPVRSENIDEIVEEAEWFADDDGIVIGVIALDKADQDWFIAVLGRDVRGDFRAIDVESCIRKIVEEAEWFADDDGIVIGVIALDKADRDWFIAVLGRDVRGDFRAIDVESCIRKIDDARSQLLAMMEKALATGERTFPQDG